MQTKTSKLLIWYTCLGNLFEHYDTALFALLSPFLAPQFFPNQDPLTALILTYAIIPIGMLARPIGSLAFGYLGDTQGRQKALIFSLLGMAIVTASMSLLPAYHQIGMAAPLLLSLGRILQNFFAAGEISGGAVYLIENTEEKKRNFVSSLYSSSTIGGILLASLGITIFTYLGIIEQWWRLLYLFGCTTACVGLALRLTMRNDPSIPSEVNRLSWHEILRKIWEMKQIAFTIAIAAGFSYATYIYTFVLLNGFIPLISNLTNPQLVHMNTQLLILDFLLLPLFGFLGTWVSSEKLMIVSSFIATVIGIPLLMLLTDASWSIALIVRICILVIGVCFSATFHAWSQQLVPKSIRYSIVGFSYACGSLLFGGPTAVISLWLYQQTNIPSSIGWYWIFLGSLSALFISKSLFLARRLCS